MAASAGLLDIVIKLVNAVWGLGNVIGELITFVINLGVGTFGVQLPPVAGNIIVEAVSLIAILYAFQKNMKWFVTIGIALVILMSIGGILQFFFPGFFG